MCHVVKKGTSLREINNSASGRSNNLIWKERKKRQNLCFIVSYCVFLIR